MEATMMEELFYRALFAVAVLVVLMGMSESVDQIVDSASATVASVIQSTEPPLAPGDCRELC